MFMYLSANPATRLRLTEGMNALAPTAEPQLLPRTPLECLLLLYKRGMELLFSCNAVAKSYRPDLTWRDIQHLCVKTARFINPNDPDWEKTAAGNMFSYKYGYGALDGYAFVKAAQDWKLVKPQAWLHTKTIQINDGKMDILAKKKYKYEGGLAIGRNGYENKMSITKEMMEEHNLEALEHIDVRVWIQHTKRGDVEVELVSPNGIISKLAGAREFDTANTGFPGWRFMTLKHWYALPDPMLASSTDQLFEGAKILLESGQSKSRTKTILITTALSSVGIWLSGVQRPTLQKQRSLSSPLLTMLFHQTRILTDQLLATQT